MKVLEETVVTLDLPYDVAVGRLTELEGYCRNKDAIGQTLEFYRYGKGKFIITLPRTSRSSRWNCLEAKAIPKGRQTDIRIRCRTVTPSPALRLLPLIVAVIGITVYLCIEAHNDTLTFNSFLYSAIVLGGAVGMLFIQRKEIDSTPADLELMKQDMLCKIEAVKRWEE